MNTSLEKELVCLSSGDWKDARLYNVLTTGSRPDTNRWLDCGCREVVFSRKMMLFHTMHAADNCGTDNWVCGEKSLDSLRNEAEEWKEPQNPRRNERKEQKVLLKSHDGQHNMRQRWDLKQKKDRKESEKVGRRGSKTHGKVMYSRQWAMDSSISPGEMGSVNSPNLNFNNKMFDK